MENKEKTYRGLFIVFTTAVFIYLLIRASRFSFSEDEAFSLLDVLYMNPGYFFGNIANTHLLNSGFLFLEIKIFGFQEVFLRIHSVLSFLIFSWVVYKFSLYIKPVFFRVVFILTITLHPFMLDYFSMARGYAMSIAFMMLSLFYLYEGINLEELKLRRKIYLASFWAALSVVSCYVMFTFYLAVLIFYVINTFLIEYEKKSWKKIILKFWNEKIFWFFHFFFSLGILYVVLKLKPSSLHEFWPYNSFWGDTIYSLVETSFRSQNQYTLWVFILFVVLILFFLAGSFWKFYKNNLFFAHSFFAILFVTIAVLLALQYYAFQITYISYRGAIFLYPLIVLMIFWSLKELIFSVSIQYFIKGLLYLFIGSMMINFASTFSFDHGIGIVSKNGFVEALHDVKALRQGEEEVSLGVSRAFPATTYYYKMRYHLDWLKNIGMGYEPGRNEYLFYGVEKIKTGDYDYFIIEEPDVAIVSSAQKIIILKRYPASGIVLAKPSN